MYPFQYFNIEGLLKAEIFKHRLCLSFIEFFSQLKHTSTIYIYIYTWYMVRKFIQTLHGRHVSRAYLSLYKFSSSSNHNASKRTHWGWLTMGSSATLLVLLFVLGNGVAVTMGRFLRTEVEVIEEDLDEEFFFMKKSEIVVNTSAGKIEVFHGVPERKLQIAIATMDQCPFWFITTLLPLESCTCVQVSLYIYIYATMHAYILDCMKFE